MTSFADRIRESARRKATVQTPGPMAKAGSITSQIQSQQTGKAGAPTQTGQSGIAAQIAASTPDPNQAALQQAGEQMAAQEQQADLQQREQEQRMEQQRAQIENQATQSAIDLLANTRASEQSLDQREDALQLEQAAAALRLQDREYMARLDRIAREKNVTNDRTFRETMQKEMIGQNLSNTLEDIAFNSDMARQQRQLNFENVMEDLQRSIAMQEARINDQRRATVIGAGAQAAKVAATYGADQGWFDSEAAVTGQDPYIGNAAPTDTPNFNTTTGFQPTLGPVR